MNKNSLKAALVILCLIVALSGCSIIEPIKKETEPVTESLSSESTTLAESKSSETSLPNTTAESSEKTELLSETVTSETEVTETTLTETEATETKPTETQAYPEELAQALSVSGYDISGLQCEQLIIVQAEYNEAAIKLFEKDSAGEWYDTGRDMYGWVGKNGVTYSPYEGDYMTPAGLYSVGEMFYIEDKPATTLDSFLITEDTYWVDDPESAFYNQRVEGLEYQDWNSAEHMIGYYYSYLYGFVINFNMDPIVPGVGSAIFFHCGTAPTAGCVAVLEDEMVGLLEVLDKAKSPYILIV